MYNLKIFLSFFCLIYLSKNFETLTFQKKVMEKTNIVITGASGLLGRALMTKFSKGSWKKVIGTAFSRYLFWIMHPTTYLVPYPKEKVTMVKFLTVVSRNFACVFTKIF